MRAYSTRLLGPDMTTRRDEETLDTGSSGVRVEVEDLGLKVTLIRRNNVLDISVDPLVSNDGRRLLTESVIHAAQARLGVRFATPEDL